MGMQKSSADVIANLLIRPEDLLNLVPFYPGPFFPILTLAPLFHIFSVSLYLIFHGWESSIYVTLY